MTAAPVLAPWNREYGILFTAEMVRAIHRGKTETRRLSCRYQVGDLLYVKETWAAFRQTSYEYDEWEQIISPHNGSWADEFEHHGPMVVEYRADFERSHDAWVRKSRGEVTCIIERWQSPLHMPKRNARIWLEVTAVRKERLQDITEEGAKAEGFESRAAFAEGWDRIHGEGAWASNPEVSVIEFRRVK